MASKASGGTGVGPGANKYRFNIVRSPLEIALVKGRYATTQDFAVSRQDGPRWSQNQILEKALGGLTVIVYDHKTVRSGVNGQHNRMPVEP